MEISGSNQHLAEHQLYDARRRITKLEAENASLRLILLEMRPLCVAVLPYDEWLGFDERICNALGAELAALNDKREPSAQYREDLLHLRSTITFWDVTGSIHGEPEDIEALRRVLDEDERRLKG